MGLFDWLRGRKPAPVRADAAGPVDGPPEFVRAVDLQRAYWTHDPDEQARLEARGVEALGWRDLLRLHHLIGLERVGGAGPAADEKYRATARRLLAGDSPHRPRVAAVWQGAGGSEGDREPDLQGVFLNASSTHLGTLEVYQLGAANRPTALDFVGFGELSGVVFARSSLVRAGKLFYDDGRAEVVFVPLLYGPTWAIGNEYDRDGRMTRFVAHLDGPGFDELGAGGVGVGHQDFTVRGPDGGGTLFGLGSVAEITFPLDMRDPGFDAKAWARGIDPDEVRRRMT